MLTRQIETSTEDDEAECGPVEGLWTLAVEAGRPGAIE